VWLDGSLFFCTGPDERKARNLDRNPHCAVTTGCNSLSEGLDVVVEGDAVRVSADTRLRRIADEYVSKYGEDWRFTVGEGMFLQGSVSALVYEVRPKKVLGFARGEDYSQTRWRF
jgi:hypothetical protein